ncbi:5-hydroxytryptamine receptor 3A-like [Chanos chanos]|uniref:5-hydroxytryptamine receptor 3A-like n=1 Tax=Chanos chanos TaxID=29144 RepID=A0A6J2VWK0_CHACN|nr:5-hydroxytryptamine receptor 3A-like [Chanos chanos]
MAKTILKFMHVTVLLMSAGSYEVPDLNSVVRNVTWSCSPWIRPVQHWKAPVHVYVDLQILAILDVNEKEEKVKLHVLISQKWRDEFVSWDPSSFGGLSRLTVPSSRVWTPDITVQEAISEDRLQAESSVCVEASGWMSKAETVLLTLRCDLAMFLFPFDKQSCNLTVTTHTHTVQDVVFVIQRTGLKASVSQYGEWELMAVKVFSVNQTHRQQEYSQLTFQVDLGRCSLFYVVNLMVPSALVMLIDVAGYAIPVDSAERIPFKVTLLFGYTVFLVLTTDLLPPFRDNTPVLGVYLVVCLVLLCVSMGESVMLLCLAQVEADIHSGPLSWLAKRVHPHLLTPGGANEHHAAYSRSLKRGTPAGLRRSFGLKHCGAGLLACGRGCVIDRLRVELEDISEELSILNRTKREHRERLILMEALDALCMKLYSSVLTMFLLSLILLWALSG